LTGARRAARALDALARGWMIAITDDENDSAPPLILSAVETAQVPDSPRLHMLISAARAETLKLINQIEAALPDAPVHIALAGPVDAGLAMAIADPAMDMAYPLKGPFSALPLENREAGKNAMQLARLAGLLPSFYVHEGTDAEEDVQHVTSADIAAYTDPEHLRLAARAQLPVSASEKAEIVAFRSDADFHEHVALIIGERDQSDPVVRLHSECLTGDVLGSLKCDCGPQLAGAIKAMTEAQWGILLYLRQEGRGIGLINKLRAYQLQDQGFDTVDANNRLGFATDSRDFGIAAQMLRLLHVERIRLMTNNPEKARVLVSLGIDIAEQIPIQIDANPHNARYLETKRDRTGHQL
jgi:GTP cyclohydrolase II